MGMLDWLFKRSTKPSPEKTDEPRSRTPSHHIEATSPRRSSAGPPRHRGDTAPNAEWIGAGRLVTLNGFKIRGGMIYVGHGLKAPTGQSEPALIDPSLPVNNKLSSSPDRDLGYWPSYDTISPEHRAVYLAWLTGGRRNPSAPIGYVFLFMYGLERRVLVDFSADSSLSSELPAIRAEMAALLETYGPQSGSFRRYAISFIDLIDVISGPDVSQTPSPSNLSAERYHVPATLRVALGRRSAHEMTIPADLALAWAWHHPENYPRTPATRCQREFARLFAIRFDQKYPDGLATRPGNARIKLSYFPASAGLRDIALRLPEIPDIFAQKVPGKKLIDLFDSVTNELDAYSRWLGRNPDGAGSLAVVALLPPDLVAGSTGAINDLRTWITDQLGQRSAVRVPAAELVRIWPSAASDRLSKAEAVSLAQLLGRLGFGFEPDVRFGGSPLTANAQIVLFREPSEAPHAATPAYHAATTLVHLAAAVGTADGDVSHHEIDHLGEHLESSLNLSPPERTRLHAHLMWLWTTDIKLNGLKKRLDHIDPSRRQSLGNLMIAIASADGVVSPGEVTILTKIFRLLGLDPDLVTSHLHASLTGKRPAPATNPVVVRPAGTPEPGFRIPPRPQSSQEHPATPAARTFALDVAAIQDKLAETAEVSVLLGNLFAEEEEEHAVPMPPQVPSQPSGAESIPSISGMDGTHSLLLRAIARRTEWSRADFEDLAAEYHLLPDGAIDVLNEAAYDVAGEPVVEGDDLLTINPYAIGELTA